MPVRGDIYKCQEHDMLVEVLHEGEGELTLHGKPMKKLTENTTDAATEKHVPVIEKVPGGYKVSVGSVEHPMLPEHYIEMIELVAGDMVMRKYLNPGDKPVAEFKTDAASVVAREYCNLHGLWKAEA